MASIKDLISNAPRGGGESMSRSSSFTSASSVAEKRVNPELDDALQQIRGEVRNDEEPKNVLHESALQTISRDNTQGLLANILAVSSTVPDGEPNIQPKNIPPRPQSPALPFLTNTNPHSSAPIRGPGPPPPVQLDPFIPRSARSLIRPSILPKAPPVPIPLPASYSMNSMSRPEESTILQRVLPGDNRFGWRPAFKDTWSNSERFAPYNWRNDLRIPTRRRSESDLKALRDLDNEPQTPKCFMQNFSRRMLVKAWKSSVFNGLAGLGTKTEGAPEGPVVGKFGATLGRAVEDQLGIDLHSDSPQALVIGYLLDTIEGIRAERNFLDDLLTRPQALGLPLPPVSANNITGQRRDSSQSNSTKEIKPQMQILHRIFCEAPEHNHDQFVYTDAPVHQFLDNFQADALVAKEPILDFTRYCSQHPEISFIVIKEHTCHGNRRVRAIGGPGSERSPRAERLHIVSPLLQKELENIALCAFPESRVRSGTDGKRIAEMNAPYLFFYHHQALISEIEKAATGSTKGHLAALVDFLEENCGHEYSEARHQIEQGIITEKHIEKLYRPNDIVFEHSSGTAYVVNDWPIVYNETLVLPCWSWKYDGAWLERDEMMLKITLPLSQNCTINNLPFIPISLVKDNSIEDLRRRGRKYWTMKKMHFGCYTGPDSTKSRHYYHTRVIVDTFTYTRMHRKIRGRPSKYMLEIPGRGAPSGARQHTRRARFDPWPEKISKDGEPDDTMVLLLPPIVVAFILQEKSWVKLDVQGVHPIEWNKKAFDRLVLEPKTKELITALVEVRIDVERSEDIIEGKGNGLMILLHGGPGTGKTLTAESVAEIAEKPLYRVTCGDIGTSAEHVEEYLEKVLYLAKVWNCVLLLDEADVFLEERTTADLERNSLVSIFLRILEYYDGILIMTSNRVGTFDEAFKSRIQVALHYEDLTKSARRTIWKNFIEVLEETGQNANISDLESHLDEMASDDFKLNGRQIRNAMTTARQLAIHRKERLDWEHVEQALRTSKEFNRYLKNVQGHTDNQWAREQRLR